MRDIQEAGLTRVFVQVSGRSDSYFPSSILPLSEEIPSNESSEDPLGSFLEAAHEAGLEVHAWVNVLFSWSRSVPPASGIHPFNLHPEWFVHDDEGKSHHAYPLERLQRRGIPGYFISPAHPGVGNLMRRYLEEIIARYDVQGIHLDYIRFPSRDTSFGWRERTDFEQEYYVDPLELRSGADSLLVETFGEAGVAALRDAWRTYRSDLITEFVASIRRSLTRIDPNIILSAAVFPNPDSSAVQYGQDWNAWLADDLVDFVVMMSYARGVAEFTESIEHPAAVTNAARVVAGVSTYNQPIASALREADLALDRGYVGVCFFSYNDLATKKSALRDIQRFLKSRP